MRTEGKTPAEILAQCRAKCQSKCCRYLVIPLPPPRRVVEFDELSWFLAHQSVSVYVQGRRWHLEVRTPCKYLDEANLCTNYDRRPQVCRDYDIEACEYPAQPKYSLRFDTREQFDRWVKRRREAQRRRRARRA